MAVMQLMPRGGDWTVDDLDHLPDDGLRYELIDGTLLVSPSPSMTHQRVVARLTVLLSTAAPPEFEVFPAPLDWRPHGRTSLQPDLLLVRGTGAEAAAVTTGLELAVEVLSPSSHRVDHVLKREVYAAAGVPWYWIVDPDEPSVLVLRLDGGSYTEAGRATGDEPLHAPGPVPVTVVPRDLVTR